MAEHFIASLLGITDEQAMWRVQRQDDAEAFARLMTRWEAPIRELCRRMTGDVHRGEDLTQEAFARVYARRKDYQPTGKFSTWLWRIALNLCYDELRRLKRRSETSLDGAAELDGDAGMDLPDAEAVGPDGALVAQETGDEVRRALQRLSEAHRAVLVLRHYEDLKFREIAEVLGVPEGTVKSRMSEALTQMGRHLARSGGPVITGLPLPKKPTDSSAKRNEPSLVL